MSQFPKFKRGDKVRAHRSIEAIVQSYFNNQGEFKYVIKYDDSPNTYEYYEYELKFWVEDLKESKQINDLGKACPMCGTLWKVTSIGTKKYYDCVPCGKKAEDFSYKSFAKESRLDDIYHDFAKFIADDDDVPF